MVYSVYTQRVDRRYDCIDTDIKLLLVYQQRSVNELLDEGVRAGQVQIWMDAEVRLYKTEISG